MNQNVDRFALERVALLNHFLNLLVSGEHSKFLSLVVSGEGLDFCGKDTQLGILREGLDASGINYKFGREPGSTSYGEAMRRFLQDPKFLERLNKGYEGIAKLTQLSTDEELNPIAEMFGYMTPRAQFFGENVLPDYVKGVPWILSRAGDSTVAYQGFGWFKGDPEKVSIIRLNNAVAMQGVKIRRTYFFDITVDEMRRRSSDSELGGGKDKIELRSDEYYERVREGYHFLAKSEPERFLVIDGSLPKQEVSQIVKADFNKLLAEFGYAKKLE